MFPVFFYIKKKYFLIKCIVSSVLHEGSDMVCLSHLYIPKYLIEYKAQICPQIQITF